MLAKLRPRGAILSGPGCARPGRAIWAGPGNKIQICALGANLNFGKSDDGDTTRRVAVSPTTCYVNPRKGHVNK
jgi:hypothetical protein